MIHPTSLNRASSQPPLLDPSHSFRCQRSQRRHVVLGERPLLESHDAEIAEDEAARGDEWHACVAAYAVLDDEWIGSVSCAQASRSWKDGVGTRGTLKSDGGEEYHWTWCGAV